MLEAFLAQLYTDSAMREQFFRDPVGTMEGLPFTDAERTSLLNIDQIGLKMAVASYAKKRAQHSEKSSHRANRFSNLLPRWLKIGWGNRKQKNKK